MCGICGIYSKKQIDDSVIKRMNDSLMHRGPDDAGIYFNCESLNANCEVPMVALANRRLAILDLSQAGHQPMSNENGSIWITYNGEIFNYLELRDELKKLGHSFRSDTDTEVVIHSYEQWGEDCLKHFNGMWGFALWDNRQKKLFCARDYFGIKPFYYFWNDSTFIFASEIKSILTHPLINKRVNEEIVYDYLTTAQIDHTEQTFFQGIKQVRPAHYLTINSSGKLNINRWWNVGVNEGIEDTRLNESEIVNRFKEPFEDSVKIRLRSDVPIGTCLSGGLDSSSIVGIINRLLFKGQISNTELIGSRQKTFSSCFNNNSCDEREFINAVTEKTQVEQNCVFPDGDKLWEELLQVMRYQDEPFGGPSIYAQWNVMRMVAQKGVKVLLDGQGGDELLAGYHNYYDVLFNQLRRNWRFLKLWQEIKLTKGVFAMRDSAPFFFYLYKIAPLFMQSVLKGIVKSTHVNMIRQTLQPVLQNRFKNRIVIPSETQESLSNALYHDVFDFSLPGPLHYEDRNSMAFSIETRLPFLDHRLVEFIFSLPANYKIRNGWTKWVLREAMKEVLPEKIYLRRDKVGFAVPEALWLEQSRSRIANLFNKTSGKTLSGDFINHQYVLDNLDRMIKTGQSRFIWRCINLEIWLQAFFS